MLLKNFTSDNRPNKTITLQNEFVVIGGGTAGVCAAITAARKGTKTVLVQDRPVLGGNASSEVRLWILGATSHMGNNNRWAREGGVIDEILVENMYRNKEGNAVIFDTILLEKVMLEENITLLLNTCVYDIEKRDENTIESVIAFCSQNSTKYILNGKLFCDASGDGIVAFKAGASFRMGAETKEEFGELFAPEESYGELLGHSMYFYSKREDFPVKYSPPAFALEDITAIPRYKAIGKDDKGCRFWWFEYGGRKDTIHDTEEIKYELWKVIYGVWNYIKNSGEFKDVENHTLEWVGTIPGKRESRRFEGLYMLKQQDVIEQQTFEDAIAHGGWAVDLHPADGVYSKLSGCTQWHSKGIYQIPYRSFVSKDISNLFLAGRIISATHVAFGSTRVMATTALCAQAVGMAASLCLEKGINPAEILTNGHLKALQNELNIIGQSIPGIPVEKQSNKIVTAKVESSSNLELTIIPFNGNWMSIATAAAQLLPFSAHDKYQFNVELDAKEETEIELQLRISENAKNYCPEIILEQQTIQLKKGKQYVSFSFSKTAKENQYAFVTFLANNKVSIRTSETRITGVLSVFNGVNKAVSNNGKQTPPKGIGVDTFEFWIPHRRPEGKNIAMEIFPAIKAFDVANIGNGFVRPWGITNAWVADLKDENPTLTIDWKEDTAISEIKLFFDTDYDHPMESTLMGHPEDVIPFCVQNYKIMDATGNVLVEKNGNHQTINTWQFNTPILTKKIVIELEHPSAHVPASIFEIICR
ncbi:fumarate reductase/succinate dehydrogenase flavo protein-like protein [Formosa agariphila KMM 3901]|uniref:Fumarate reductase/succinate dehydrogenase flavo protein-like protein n=1 Tax=Formosa agariphila (strain DSM 15362 / KCTC 12365 / LMG 23005 / KMM 3901 / M-2Alg 35-1) TaxID=1347342 RepID=T2KLT3_FORAG|nr:FAD-dependent oxidoreductase [Formosa agariphila]CDF79837.1 fumarate reductase/succinate dehydrogenase flavo protein-like protein [Formosa agariphila KMM 3901]